MPERNLRVAFVITLTDAMMPMHFRPMNHQQPWLGITSIPKPNEALRSFADGCREHGFQFLVIGDSKRPAGFELDGCDFWSLERQLQSGLKYAQLCPTKH